jgi:hypothetical protein
MNAIVINRSKAAEILKNTDGGFFSAKFVKKDGSLRKMIGRRGVKKGVKGVGSTVARPDTPYVTVFDTVKKNFRVLNLETLLEIKTRGQVFLIEGYNKYVEIVNNEFVLVKEA